MPNANDYTLQSEKILAVGGVGGGKSAGFLTIPGKKFMYIFDPNTLSTIKGHNVDYEIFTPDVLNLKAVTLKKGVADTTRGQPPEPRTYVEFEEDFEQRLNNGFFDDYNAIGFDSMTTFSDIVMDRIMYLNNRFGKWPEQADWTASMNTIKNVIRTWTSIEGCISYVTAHNEFKQEDVSGKMMNTLVLIGRLRNSLPLLFSEIWRFYADTDKDGNPRYYIQTTQDRYNPYIRNTMRGLSPVEDVTIENWMKPEDYGISALIQKSTS